MINTVQIENSWPVFIWNIKSDWLWKCSALFFELFFSTIVLQSHAAINVGLAYEIVLSIETVRARILITVYRSWYLIIANDDNNYNNT